MNKHHYLTQLSFFFLTLFSLHTHAQETAPHLSPPPKVYEKVLKAQLSELKEGKKLRKQMSIPDDAEELSLVREVHFYVDEQYKKYTLFHYAEIPLSKTGIEWNKKTTYGFSHAREKIYFIGAETIYPDGQVKKVDPKSVVIKIPQSNENVELYSDRAEMIIIFPDVKEDVIVRSIVLKEEFIQPVANHFIQPLHFGYYSPTALFHGSLNLPKAIYDKLQERSIGKTPKAQKREENGRVILDYHQKRVKQTEWEKYIPPSTSIGPVTKFTTLKSWDAFCAWYRDLIADRQAIPETLKKELLSWGKGKSKQDIIEHVLNIVSNDIRYTGLEFGIAGWQPKACIDTWNKKYGDCKDKSLLMCAMLKVFNIKASIALLNTDDDGYVDLENPSYREFDHAIVAIDDGEQTIFCDPTIEYASPGVLSPSSRFRKALVIRDKDHAFIKTPETNAGPFELSFQLNLKHSGELEGSVTIDAYEYWASTYKDYLDTINKKKQKAELQKIVGRFFDNVDIFDVVCKDIKQGSHYKVKAFFSVQKDKSENQKNILLSMKEGRYILHNFGQIKKRTHPYPQTAEVINIAYQYTIPKGWKIQSLPDAIDLQSDSLHNQASWKIEKQNLIGRIHSTSTKNKIMASEYPNVFAKTHSLRAWLAKPIILEFIGKDSELANATLNQQKEQIKMPIMPSAEGQLSYINSKYPRDEVNQLREQALRQLIQYFPNGKQSVYEATIEIATIKIDEKKEASQHEAIKIIDQAIAQYKDQIKSSYINWGHYMKALAYENLKDSKTANSIYQKLAFNPSHSNFRRGWSYVRYIITLEDEKVDRLKVLEEALQFESEASTSLLSRVLEHAVKEKRLQHGLSMIKKYFLDFPEDKSRNLASVLRYSQNYVKPDSKDTAQELKQFFKSLDVKNIDHASVQKYYKIFLERFESLDATQGIVQVIEDYLKKDQHGDWAKTKTPYKDKDDLIKKIDVYADDEPSLQYLKATMLLLTKFNLDLNEFNRRVWLLSQHVYATSLEERYANDFITFALMIPSHKNYHQEGLFVRGKIQRSKKHYKKAITTFSKIIENLPEDKVYTIPAHGHLGMTYERIHNYEKALAEYKFSEKEHQQNHKSYHYLLRAVMINLHLKRYDEALRIINILANADEDDLKNESRTQSYSQIKQLIDLAKDPEKAKFFWNYHEKWWTTWLSLSKDAKLELDPKSIFIPLIDDPEDYRIDIEDLEVEGNEKGIMRRVHNLAVTAKWFPEHLLEYSKLFDTFEALYPGKIKTAKKHFIQICKDIPLSVAQKKAYLVQQIDLELSDESLKACLKSVKRYFQLYPGDSDPDFQLVARFYLIAAHFSQSERKEASDLIQSLLAKYPMEDFRGYTVYWLANTLVGLKQSDKALKILETESKKVAVQESGEYKNIQALIKRIKHIESRGQSFSIFVNQWLDQNKPIWYEYAQPQSKDKPSLMKLRRIINNQSGIHNDLEIFKAHMLTALSTEAQLADRIEALVDATYILYAYQKRFDDSQKLFMDVVNNKDIHEKTRRLFLWHAIYQAYEHQQYKTIQKLELHPLTDAFNEGQQQSIEGMHQELSADLDDLDQAIKWMETISEKPVSNQLLVACLNVFDRATCLLEFEKCKQIRDIITSFQFKSDVESNPLELKLQLTRTVSEQKAYAPIYKRLRTQILDAFKDRLNDKFIQSLEDYKFIGQVIGKDKHHRFDIELYKLQKGYIFPSDTDFFVNLYSMSPDENIEKTIRKIFKSVTKDTYKDDTRAFYNIYLAFNLATVLTQEELKALLDGFDMYDQANKFPLAHSFLKMFKIAYYEQHKIKYDIESELSKIIHPTFKTLVPILKLGIYYNKRDPQQTKTAFEDSSIELMSSSDFIVLSMLCAQYIGKDDEAEILKEILDEKAYQATLLSWASFDSKHINNTFAYLNALKKGAAYPQAWMDSILKHSEESSDKLNIQFWDAWLKQEWNKVIEIAGKIDSDHQGDHYHWFIGKSYHQLGKVKLAKENLKIYLDESKELSYYHEVQALYEKLTKS